MDVASGTALDQCHVLYLLVAWRDLLVVLASTKVSVNTVFHWLSRGCSILTTLGRYA